jgi:carbonic anhydrase
MDTRSGPAKYAGLAEGDAQVIRNAGGRAIDDAIRSLVISHKLLGTLEYFVAHCIREHRRWHRSSHHGCIYRKA